MPPSLLLLSCIQSCLSTAFPIFQLCPREPSKLVHFVQEDLTADCGDWSSTQTHNLHSQVVRVRVRYQGKSCTEWRSHVSSLECSVSSLQSAISLLILYVIDLKFLTTIKGMNSSDLLFFSHCFASVPCPHHLHLGPYFRRYFVS